MFQKLRTVLATALFGIILAASVVTMAQAGTENIFQNTRINNVVGTYSRYVLISDSGATTPYLKYQQVYTKGYYGVTTYYTKGGKTSYTTAKQYYAENVAGRVLTGTKFKAGEYNRVLMYRSGGFATDILVDTFRFSH